MDGISIDQMILEMPGVPESQARRLAMGIAGGLAIAGLSGAAGEVPTLHIDLTANAGADTDNLARQVVAEIVRQLNRI